MTSPRGDAHTGFLAGGGEMAARARDHDWARTPLGPSDSWSASLRTAIGMILGSRYPMFLAWGEELAFVYNDGYAPILGDKHPGALGRPFAEVWREIWPDIEPLVQRSLAGESTWSKDLLLFMERYGFPEETYYTFSYSPLRDETGEVRGMFCACTETTREVRDIRQLSVLRDVPVQTSGARTRAGAAERAMLALANDAHDLPFALVYLPHGAGGMRLAGASGFADGIPETLTTIEKDDDRRWPAPEYPGSGGIAVIDDVAARLGVDVPCGPWPVPPSRAAVVSFASSAGTGTLVVGINPFRPFDDAYRDFLVLTAGQIAAGITNADAFEQEQMRARALAQLDRAKTTFFSNVSHELRTPLTLILGPLQDALADETCSEALRGELAVAQRNGRRLLRLVNSLLDFTRIEAGRVRPLRRPVDLARLTAAIVSTFRSAVEKAGLRLDVDCPPLRRHVPVDREMWEKIVLNLLSNAFKHTFEGSIVVELREEADHAVLTVRDTGTGISETALPRVFERFYRIEGARGRTQEGTGIGLALVAELARLLGGSVSATSRLGEGSAFTVRIPLDVTDADAGPEDAPAASDTLDARAFVDDAWAWTSAEEYSEARATAEPGGDDDRPRVLVVDDNADMRGYVARILSPRFHVTEARNGVGALAAATRERPDIVVTDVMMPRMDGFTLIRRLRSDPATASVPVLVLSARAGEEATIEGLREGADAYVVKPFAARELLVRVEAQLELSRLRREAAHALEESEARLRLVTDAMPALIAYVDGEERYRYNNHAYERWFGRPASEFTGRSMRDVLGDAAYEVIAPAIRRCLAGETVQFESRLEYRYGGPRDVEVTYVPERTADGDVRGFYILVVDVTERARAMRELRESEIRFRLLADAAPVPMWVTSPEGDAVHLNRAWSVFTGIAAEDPESARWLEAVHPHDRAMVAEAFRAAGETREPVRVRFRLRRHDGEYRWFLGSGAPRGAHDAEHAGCVGSAVDITEIEDARRVVEEHNARLEQIVHERTAELDASHRRLRLGERMASLGTLAAGLGHDMGNLLVPMRVRLDSLAAAPLGDDARKDVEVIGTAAEYLRKLANGLRLLALDPERVRTKEVTEVHEWWDDAEPVLRNAVPRGIAVTATLPDGPCTIAMTRAALTQAVFNLVQNAGDALRERGRGNVGVAIRREAPATVVVSVTDDGPGMSEEVRAHCMEPFFTTKTRGISTGLGLAFVYGLVNDAGGSIEVESEEGSGTTFHLRLPEAQVPREAARVVRPAAVVLSDQRTRALVNFELRSAGFRVEPDAESCTLLVTDSRDELARFPAGRPAVLVGERVSDRPNVFTLVGSPSPRALREAVRSAANAVREVER